ncbi:UNVERIFIED_CONTAM: hypothetical protein GTU68_059595, partial [Idotea baltica]|nr:hypothetical protein [Idotea baltica]
KFLRVEDNISRLISFGTAICGGSAIAALAPTIKAKQEEIAIALATVFTLNALALFLFPLIGHSLGMSQESFGVWAALGIHDTSSVVGATSGYGQTALDIGVTVKLTRALWIIPFILLFSALEGSEKKIKIPLFILGFILASSLRSLLPQFESCFNLIASASKQLLVVTLFLIGSGLSRAVLKQVGAQPLIQGLLLWLTLSVATLVAVLSGIL